MKPYPFALLNHLTVPFNRSTHYPRFCTPLFGGESVPTVKAADRMHFGVPGVGCQSVELSKNSLKVRTLKPPPPQEEEQRFLAALCLFRAGYVIEPQDGGYGLSIADGSLDRHADRGRQGHKTLIDKFIILGLGLAGAKACRQKDRHGFGDEAGASKELQDTAPFGGGITGFLQQFAFGGFEFLLSGIDATRG